MVVVHKLCLFSSWLWLVSCVSLHRGSESTTAEKLKIKAGMVYQLLWLVPYGKRATNEQTHFIIPCDVSQFPYWGALNQHTGTQFPYGGALNLNTIP